MIQKQRYNLISIIGNDLLYHAKLSMLLLIAILVSAILVVATTNQTRQLTSKREEMILEKEMIDIEWRKLILEENALSNHDRIENIAVKELQMQHVDLSQDNLLVRP